MDHGLSRRGMLAGLGAAAGAATVAALAPAAGATTVSELQPNVLPRAADAPRADLSLLTPGLTYEIIDPTEFSGEPANGRVITPDGAQLASPGTLFAPVRLPVGATLKELTITYINTAGLPKMSLKRMTPGLGYKLLGSPLNMPPGAGIESATMNVIVEPTDGSTSFMVEVNVATTHVIQLLRIGYEAPPQAFIPLNPVPRVLDTRAVNSKLNNNEERIVPLGVPGFARAAVINLTVTETENAGYVAAFAANAAWPGNSSINWSTTNQNLANGVITAIDPNGNIKIRGGVSRTHVVIDVQGYLL